MHVGHWGIVELASVQCGPRAHCDISAQTQGRTHRVLECKRNSGPGLDATLLEPPSCVTDGLVKGGPSHGRRGGAAQDERWQVAVAAIFFQGMQKRAESRNHPGGGNPQGA